MADSPFVWGAGGAQMTPEAIAAQRKVAEAMMTQGMDYTPIKSWTQGAARVAQALVGGLDARRADDAERTNAAADRALLTGIGFGGAKPAAPTGNVNVGPVTPAPVSSPMGATTIPVAGGEGDLGGAIAKVAAARGVDPAYLTRLAAVESGGNINAANPNSSARGPFQFINSTAKQYGLTNPTDPASSADAAARLTLDNKAALTTALGREPTPGELYLAHQQGAGGASKILGNPNAPIEVVVGTDAARLNGAAPGMTAGQFAQKWTGKFGDTPAAALPAAPAASNVNPAILKGLTSPYTSEATKKILGVMLQNQLSSDAVTNVDLGNKVGIMDKRGNLVRTIDKGEPNKGPEYRVTGKDQYGNEQYGWVDPRTQTVTPTAKPTADTAPSTLPPVPPGVDPKVWRETFSKNAAAGATPANFDDTSKLRTEVAQLPSYKNLAQAAPIYKSMHDAAGRNTKAADLNMVYGLGKIMDPGSVVREGEIQMANNAQGWQEKLNGIIGQINGQGGLTPEGRQALMAEAHSRVQSYKMMYDQDAGRYRGIAQRNRANPDDVVQDFGEFSPWMAPKAAPPAAAAPAVIDGYTIKAR